MRTKSGRDVFKDKHGQVTTWIPKEDVAILQHLARENNVTMAAYLRAIIVDIIEDERHTIE